MNGKRAGAIEVYDKVHGLKNSVGTSRQTSGPGDPLTNVLPGLPWSSGGRGRCMMSRRRGDGPVIVHLALDEEQKTHRDPIWAVYAGGRRSRVQRGLYQAGPAPHSVQGTMLRGGLLVGANPVRVSCQNRSVCMLNPRGGLS